MPKILQIDFISDIACPWCVIGLGGLDRALESLRGEVSAEIVFHPFELNPNMQEGGENSLEHITKKYRISAEEARINRERIQDAGTGSWFHHEHLRLKPRLQHFSCAPLIGLGGRHG